MTFHGRLHLFLIRFLLVYNLDGASGEIRQRRYAAQRVSSSVVRSGHGPLVSVQVLLSAEGAERC